ncbi:MAG TPA: DinB family protein [Xanthobacteraceae bacterium]|nr:DinB family protein [Xanthobacteraceae bacterium]
MKSRYIMFAAYNRWANDRLYAVAARLKDNDYHADRGAFFKSVHGTLNHLLVADRIWMRRFTGTGTAPDRLDAILYGDLAGLRAARRDEDARIVNYVDGLSDADLAGVIRYRTVVQPVAVEQELAPALDHFFNHQTHHRGQVHCLMTAITGDCPSLDLVLFQRERLTGGIRKVG